MSSIWMCSSLRVTVSHTVRAVTRSSSGVHESAAARRSPAPCCRAWSARATAFSDTQQLSRPGPTKSAAQAVAIANRSTELFASAFPGGVNSSFGTPSGVRLVVRALHGGPRRRHVHPGLAPPSPRGETSSRLTLTMILTIVAIACNTCRTRRGAPRRTHGVRHLDLLRGQNSVSSSLFEGRAGSSGRPREVRERVLAEIMREYGEYKRTSTTVLNAYVGPDRTLARTAESR